MNEIFWGLWLLPFGLLVYRSGFLPRFLGVWLMLACFGWLVAQPYRLTIPALLRCCFSDRAAGHVCRARDHALASDQRRKGANSSSEARFEPAGRSDLVLCVRPMKLKRILKVDRTRRFYSC